MRYLIGVDGSPKSLEAVRLVGRLADPARDAVAICFSPLELERQLPGQSREVIDGAVSGLFEEACGLLPKGLSTAPQHIRVDQPAALALLESAGTWKADVLVVGARGHGSIEGFILGSVSRAVVHGAHLPVLVARAVPPADRGPRVLVGHHPVVAHRVVAAGRRAGAAMHALGCLGDGPRWIAHDHHSEKRGNRKATNHWCEVHGETPVRGLRVETLTLVHHGLASSYRR